MVGERTWGDGAPKEKASDGGASAGAAEKPNRPFARAAARGASEAPASPAGLAPNLKADAAAEDPLPPAVRTCQMLLPADIR